MAAPNIILITVGAWRHAWEHEAFKDRRSTPNLDSLAVHGVRFDQAISSSPAPWTALTSIFWGQSPPRHGVWQLDGPFPPPDQSLPGLLRARKYHTLATGRMGAVQDALRPVFDEYASSAGRNLHGEDEFAWIGDQAVRFVQPLYQPFLLWMHFAGGSATPGGASDSASAPDGDAPPFPFMSQVDRQTGRVLAVLTARALTNNIVIFTALAGADIALEGLGADIRAIRESAIRVPLIVAGIRGQRRGARDSALTQPEDLLPTLAGACALTLPAHCDGLRLQPQLNAADQALRSVAVAYAGPNTRIARNARYKLALSETHGLQVFFDLLSDPGEEENLFQSTKASAIREALASHLK